MSNIPTSEVLDLAADQIQTHGWGRGSATWDPGSGRGVCIEGAIAAASGIKTRPAAGWMVPSTMDLQACPAYIAVAEYLDFRGTWLWMYNDTIAKDATEVIAVLRAAAAVERAKEDCPLGSTPEVQMAGARA